MPHGSTRWRNGFTRTVVRWLLKPGKRKVPRWWLHCPIRDRELAGPHPAGAVLGGGPMPAYLPPAREELIAKCPVQDRRPFNDPDEEPPYRYESVD